MNNDPSSPEGRFAGLANEVMRLEAENRQLGEQVKLLARTETRLYASQQALDTHRAMYRHLADVGRSLASSTDLDNIVKVTVEFVLYGVGLQRCVVLLEHDGRYEVRALDGYESAAEKARVAAMAIAHDDPVLSRFEGAVHALAHEATARDEDLLRLGESVGMDEFFLLPLGSLTGEDSGLLIAGNTLAKARHHTRVSADGETMTLLGSLSSHVATTIENARRYHALRIRNIEVEHANKMKSAFLATMSHELRTPMNAIIGFTRLVMKKCAGVLPERQFQNLTRVENSALSLLAIINDILDLSKVEAGRAELVFEEVSAKELLEDVVESLRPLATAKSLALNFAWPSDSPTITTDVKRLRQVVTNLLSNAIKFTKAGSVTLAGSWSPTTSRMVLQVIDTGVGMPETEHAVIFEPFHQLDGSMTREVGGTGLGLAIVKELVSLLGGTINVTSKLGTGSTFTVDLPIKSGTPHRSSSSRAPVLHHGSRPPLDGALHDRGKATL